MTLRRHHGDPAREYAAATREGAALFDRGHRTRLLLHGRAPGQMLHGIVTGSIPEVEGAGPGGWVSTRAAESLVLTPKGKIVTDLRLVRLASGDEAPFLLELPAPGREPLLEHFGRYLPPRFARASDLSDTAGAMAVVGPRAAELLAGALGAGALGAVARDAVAPDAAALDAESLEALAPGEARLLGIPSLPEATPDPAPPAPDGEAPPQAPWLLVIRSGALHPPAFEVVGTPATLDRIRLELEGEGVLPAGESVWQTLRIERGTPETGAELDDGVLPPEAGLEHRAIDHRKGCYTGQEVIVRIRDRGRVNRHLRGLLLGDAPAPARGTSLFPVPPAQEGAAAEPPRPVGEVLTTAQSPRFGQGVALAWVRREVEPGGWVALGGPEGSRARVVALGDEGWEVDPGEGER